MKRERYRTASLILGSVLALAVVFSQFLTQNGTPSEKVKTEQNGDTSDDQSGPYISMPTFSLPAPVSVPENLDAHFLFEIFFEDDSDQNPVEENVSFADRFLQTIFQVIISPNAP